MKSKVSKKGIIFLLVSVFIITILFTDVGKVFETKSQQVAQCSDSAECSKALQVLLDPNSIVDTDVKLTESNDDILTRFIDEQDIGFSEKLGIETQVALFDSSQNIYTVSNVLGIPQLSVQDSQGRLLDLGSIQTSFLAISKSKESVMNVWGTVKFYLDDDLISTKRLWLSTTDSQKADIILTNNLSFVNQQTNTERLSQINNLISTHKSQIQKLESDKSYWLNGNFGNSQANLDLIENNILELNKKIILLEAEKDQINKDNLKRVPLSPPFNDRKTNFTFTLSDENRNWEDNSEHHYRVVITEIVGNLNSDKNYKEFSWNGEYIAYDLKVTVDATRLVVLDENNNAVSIFKSDDTLLVTSFVRDYNGYNQPYPFALMPEPISVYVKHTNELLGVVDNSFFARVENNHSGCAGYPVERCGTSYSAKVFWKNPIIKNIPRNTELVFKSPSKTVEFTTPKSQMNLTVECSQTKEWYDQYNVCKSNFGYKYP